MVRSGGPQRFVKEECKGEEETERLLTKETGASPSFIEEKCGLWENNSGSKLREEIPSKKGRNRESAGSRRGRTYDP